MDARSAVDHVPAAGTSSVSTNCGDELNRNVDEDEPTTDDCDCEHIDVDTVDDSPPQSSAAAAEGLNTASLGIRCYIVMI